MDPAKPDIQFVARSVEKIEFGTAGGLSIRSKDKPGATPAIQVAETVLPEVAGPAHVPKDIEKAAVSGKSLYEQLQAQKLAAEEVAKKTRGPALMPHGLDEEEIEFLTEVDDSAKRAEEERRAQQQRDRAAFELARASAPKEVAAPVSAVPLAASLHVPAAVLKPHLATSASSAASSSNHSGLPVAGRKRPGAPMVFARVAAKPKGAGEASAIANATTNDSSTHAHAAPSPPRAFDEPASKRPATAATDAAQPNGVASQPHSRIEEAVPNVTNQLATTAGALVEYSDDEGDG